MGPLHTHFRVWVIVEHPTKKNKQTKQTNKASENDCTTNRYCYGRVITCIMYILIQRCSSFHDMIYTEHVNL